MINNTDLQPAYMGDILDDIFGGSFRTPGVKASEDILIVKTITPALAFEELESIRRSPTTFILFYTDAKEHKVLESLHFILEVEEFAALPLDFRIEREREIIENYLTIGALNEINVPDNQRKTVNEKIDTKCEDIFTEVQKYITHMLIRNVDSTWKYKTVPPPKRDLKGKNIKKAIDKLTEEERLRDLIYYFLDRRITPLMYKARTSVSTLQRKVRTSAPIGYAIFKIKHITEVTIDKSPSGFTIYMEAKCLYKNPAGFIRDKKSQVRSSPKKGIKEFKWEEELKFEVKDKESQVVEFLLMEKKFLSDSIISSFTLDLVELIDKPEQDIYSEVKISLDDGYGELLLDFHYQPNKDELLRIQKEKEKREQLSRTTATDYDFLIS